MDLKKSTTILLLCSLITLILVLVGCNSSNSYLKQIDFNTLKVKIADKETFALYVGNKSCTHCQSFEPKLINVVNTYKVGIFKLDTSTMTNDEYAEFVSLIDEIATPRVLFFYDGIESGTANRIDGDVSEEKIILNLTVNGYIKD
ncbi:MAG: hypothetical protein WC343_13940 [Bacilli bacterium]|jgi:predicted bacteriocin transport accessory protein